MDTKHDDIIDYQEFKAGFQELMERTRIRNVIKDINNDNQGVYDNVKIPITGAEVDLKKYIKVIEIMITNPQAKPEDIPMLIDVEHYKKALAKRGPLSEKEKIKAEE